MKKELNNAAEDDLDIEDAAKADAAAKKGKGGKGGKKGASQTVSGDKTPSEMMCDDSRTPSEISVDSRVPSEISLSNRTPSELSFGGERSLKDVPSADTPMGDMLFGPRPLSAVSSLSNVLSADRPLSEMALADKLPIDFSLGENTRPSSAMSFGEKSMSEMHFDDKPPTEMSLGDRLPIDVLPNDRRGSNTPTGLPKALGESSLTDMLSDDNFPLDMTSAGNKNKDHATPMSADSKDGLQKPIDNMPDRGFRPIGFRPIYAASIDRAQFEKPRDMLMRDKRTMVNAAFVDKDKFEVPSGEKADEKFGGSPRYNPVKGESSGDKAVAGKPNVGSDSPATLPLLKDQREGVITYDWVRITVNLLSRCGIVAIKCTASKIVGILWLFIGPIFVLCSSSFVHHRCENNLF